MVVLSIFTQQKYFFDFYLLGVQSGWVALYLCTAQKYFSHKIMYTSPTHAGLVRSTTNWQRKQNGSASGRVIIYIYIFDTDPMYVFCMFVCLFFLMGCVCMCTQTSKAVQSAVA